MDESRDASCYGSMVASTSAGGGEAAARARPDGALDLSALKQGVLSAQFDESGYQSVMARSQHSQFGTGWMVADTVSVASNDSNDDWDGYMTVGSSKLKIRDVSSILATRYAFVSGAKTRDGFPIVTFPDSRSQVSFADYYHLLTYLLHSAPTEDNQNGHVLIADRRMDKWPAVRTLLTHITNYFPAQIRVVFLLKPEGVLQRAVEVGFRSLIESCSVKVIVCQNAHELHQYISRACLTVDVGGAIVYNHLEWVQHRMDIERMKSSAAVIANSLGEFSRCLKDTELPNDAETTAHILETQQSERESIQEDFRIAGRRGLSLLRSVRQADVKPAAEQLSPTRLLNVTAIERMLVQLDETERSFDVFWTRHERRLRQCLQLRRFEERFRQLQSCFAQHMLYLEEHRDVGDGLDKAEQLAVTHQSYMHDAQEDVSAATELQRRGLQLVADAESELEGSLLPKCDELGRMADALDQALQRRLQVLRLSKHMHQQITSANQWCNRGVNIMSGIPYDTPNRDEADKALAELQSFLDDGAQLQFDALDDAAELNNLILLTTTDTSTLLQQVSARIDDVRKMCEARHAALERLLAKERAKPVQAVSPEKCRSVAASPCRDSLSSVSVDLPSPAGHSSQTSFVIAELLATERTYVAELRSVVEHFVAPFADESLPTELRDKRAVLFGNLADICRFHETVFVEALQTAAASDAPVADVCHCFLRHKDAFALYTAYCQNKTRSDALRQQLGANCQLLQECQRRSGHRLPLGAYLLKPVQRVTKYQLLLRELLKENAEPHVDAALGAMLDLLHQLNASLHQINISGYPGDLNTLGAVLLEGRFNICVSKLNSLLKLRLTNKPQQRHLFLFSSMLIVCKRRGSSAPRDYYEFKAQIPLQGLGLTEHVKSAPLKFELWTAGRQDVLVLQPVDERARHDWLAKLRQMIVLKGLSRVARPHSWASSETSSNARVEQSSIDSSLDIGSPDLAERTASASDSNNNPPSPCSLDEAAEDESDRENNSVSSFPLCEPQSSQPLDAPMAAEDQLVSNTPQEACR